MTNIVIYQLSEKFINEFSVFALCSLWRKKKLWN